MKTDLAFILLELNNNKEHDLLLGEIATLAKHNPYKQICVFNAYSEKIDNKNVPILPLSHAKFFNGDIMVFDTLSLMLIQHFPNIQKKYYYTHTTEWTITHNNYSVWESLFNQPNLHIIAQNNTTYDIYNLCWQKPIAIMQSFSYQELKNVL